MTQADKDLERVKLAVASLSEHFDTVQIFATRYQSEGEAEAIKDQEGTVNVNWGCGNWFARIGQIRNWVLKEDEADRENVRRSDNP